MKQIFQLLSLGLLLLCAATVGQLSAQDLHYSQIFSSPLNLSPALAGLYGGEHRVVGNARNQWRSATPDYVSGALSYDTKINYRPGLNGWFGVGVQLNYDRAGTSQLSLASLGLNGNYTRRLAERHLLTGGVQLAGGRRYFDTGGLIAPDQFNPGKPDLNPSQQTYDNTGRSYPSLSAGLNWRYQVPESRTFINIGGGVYHINNPDVSFMERNDIKIDQRYSSYVLGTLMLSSRFDLIANYTQQWQGPHREPMAGVRGKFYVANPLVKTLALQLGAHYRFDDAIIPVVVANVNQWEVGFSYDINTSRFNTATNANGGPELSVIYTFTKIRPDICLLCPEYL